jgi:hypothetical protein
MLRPHFRPADRDAIARAGARSALFRDAASEIDRLGELRELDFRRLRRTFSVILEAAAESDPSPMVLTLIRFDNFVRRCLPHRLPGLLEGGIPSLLLELSRADHPVIRRRSLSILSHLTALIPDFLCSFDAMDVVAAVHDNLLCPFFPGKSGVFVWLGNIIKSYTDLLQRLTDAFPLADIYCSAIELVVEGETKFVTYFFYHFTQLARNSPEVFEICREIFYFFFRKAAPNPDIFILLGTHSLLAAVAIPAGARLDLVESLQLLEFLRTAFGGEVTESTFIAAAILADICKLGLPVGDGVIEMLDVVHAVSCAESSPFAAWHEYLYEALAKVLEECGEEVLVELWNANEGAVLVDLGAAWRNGSFAQRRLVAECLFAFVNGLPVEEVVKEEVVEVIFEIVEADGEWMEQFVGAVERMADVPEFLEVFQALDGIARVADWEENVTVLNDVLRDMFGGDDVVN